MLLQLLNLHPCIEILEGKLTATKKYRGKMMKVAVQMLKEYTEKYNLDSKIIWFVYTIGFADEIKLFFPFILVNPFIFAILVINYNQKNYLKSRLKEKLFTSKEKE